MNCGHRVVDIERMSAFNEPGLELLTATKTIKPITSNAIIGQGRLKNSQLFMDSTFFSQKTSKNPYLILIFMVKIQSWHRFVTIFFDYDFLILVRNSDHQTMDHNN